MILGMGCDIVDIRRIEKVIKRHGEKFIKKVFSHAEINNNIVNTKQASYYAKRFAAKEAFVKALGLGFREGISWNEISLLNNYFGKPYLEISGRALQQMKKLTAMHGDAMPRIHVSLSDEFPYAQAVVIIEHI